MPFTGIYGGYTERDAQNRAQEGKSLSDILQFNESLQKSRLSDLQYQQLMQTQPLALEKLRLENARANRLNSLITQEYGSGETSAAGAGIPSGMPAGAAAAAAQPQRLDEFSRKLRIANALSLDDPARGRALMEGLKLQFPEVKWEGGIALHPRTGQPMNGAPIIPQTNQQGYATTKRIDPVTGEVSISTTPGAADAYRQQQEIAANVGAANKLVTVPSTSPNMPPVYRSEADLLRAAREGQQTAQPSPQPAGAQNPNDLAFLNSPQFAAMPPEQQAAVRRLANSSGPTNIIVPGQQTQNAAPANAAGVSPNQAASIEANKVFQVEDAKSRAEAYTNMQRTAMTNQPKIAKFERIGQLLGDYSGGKLAETGYELARLGTSLGIQIDPKLPNKEAANTLSNEVALELRSTAEGGGMPGAMSDADRNFLKSMTPQLAQTAEGRKLIIESRVSIWKREQKIAEMARQYRQKHGSIDEDFFSQLQNWSNRNPIFQNATR